MDEYMENVTGLTKVAEKIFAAKFFPFSEKETKSKIYYLSTIVQKTSMEIITAIFQEEFLESIIPGLNAIEGKDELSASWTLFCDDTSSTTCVLNISLNTESSLYWELLHPQGSVTGRVQLFDLPKNRGTLVNFISNGELHKDSLFKIVRKLFTNDDQYTLEDVVKRFKALLESGNIPTTVGQPHGNRGKQA